MSKEQVSLHSKRHSLSHVLAQAVLDMFPDASLAIGPDIDNGFYYDFDLPRTLIPEDLPIIEKKMKHIIKQNQKFESYVEPIDKAIEFLKETKQGYKVELVEDLATGGETEVSFYKNGPFVDLCKGPHVESTNKIDLNSFKLDKIAGAYWRGDEKRPMLQRIYGLAFDNKDELTNYLFLRKEAEKRDHRKLGKQLDLYSFHDVGQGFPFIHPKGMVIWNELIKYWKEVHDRYGYLETKTPIILNRELWEKSGHWQNYRENMYTTVIDDVDHAIKPMNCPGGMILYKNDMHSYRELPIKAGEIGLVHRHELSGVLSGLFRVRSFHQDDSHIFMTVDQIKENIIEVIKIAEEIYGKFGLDFHLELSTRPEKSIGTDEQWEAATNGLREALDEYGKGYDLNEGDGAFYGPKIDFHIEDALGRTWQCGTIQLDMSLPERFELTYEGADGEKHRPVMIHRVIYGSVERFFGIIVEHFAGAFPVWLAPVQVAILPVADVHEEYANKVLLDLKESGVRTLLMTAEETLGKRIRTAEKQRVPYMLVVGDKEVEDKAVTVRDYKTKEQNPMKTGDFAKQVLKEIQERSL